MSIARLENEPPSPAPGDVPARSTTHTVRRFLSSARLVLDVIASTGCRDMGRGELDRRMSLRGHGLVETNKMIVLLLWRGMLTADDTTLVMTDIGCGVAAKRTPSNRVRA